MAVVTVADETCDSRLEWVLVRVDDSFSLSKLDGPDVTYVILPLSMLEGPLAMPRLRLVLCSTRPGLLSLLLCSLSADESCLPRDTL